ncbi:MAG: glycine oxidase ThiO [Chloroflexi bacterium]|nr:glycine oxidase ThiO [Chloroflexota bacterium]
MTTTTTDAIIVGGGVIGCAIGYYLAKAGVATTILERGEIGMEATNAATGVLSHSYGDPDDPYTRLMNTGLSMFHELAPELAEASGVDIELAQCGELQLALNEEQAHYEQAVAAELGWFVNGAQWLDAQKVREMEPLVSEDIAGALFMPEVCRVNNQRLSTAYARSAQRLGASVREHTEVIGLVRSRLRISGVRLHSGELSADHVIIAAGPWTASIAEVLGSDVPVRPVRGVNLNLKPVSGNINAVVHGGWGLLAPRNDGTVVVGATVEEAGFDNRVTAGAVQSIMNMCELIIPSLRDASLNWALSGLRPGSPDDAPMLGAVPGWQGLHIATGHFRSGILLSAITGKLMAEHITGEEPELIDHFSPTRFSRMG